MVPSIAGASLFADGYQGTARMVVDEDRGIRAGITLVGVGEMIHAATVAIAGVVPLQRLWHSLGLLPTMSEVWLRLPEIYGL